MKNVFPTVVNNTFTVPDVFDNFFNNFMWPVDDSYTMPKVDVEDKGDAYVMTADMPGVAKEDIHLTYDNDMLTLSAVHEDTKDNTDEQKHYICKERSSTSFCRQFPVSGIKKDAVQASFKDGVLTVMMPKEMQQPQQDVKTIEIQ
ncbi:Hsp20/alpha crystallin family protein [uncultured Megasphaera sp.]|uniref:Hsp20/alpha crystallin family protein n=1 Tax=uncultured Megasphaera sp. TaxID=165188 RepID=UPI00265B5D6B|nr:Hsp20/alpha crystallin family protein [uncultured Megasphaera sp.]